MQVRLSCGDVWNMVQSYADKLQGLVRKEET